LIHGLVPTPSEKCKRRSSFFGADCVTSGIRTEGSHFPERGGEDSRGRTAAYESFYCRNVKKI